MKIAAIIDFPYWEGNVGTAIRHESLCQSLSKVCDLTVISSVTMHSSDNAFAESAPYKLLDRKQLKQIDRYLGDIRYPGVRPDRLTTVRSISALCQREQFDAVLTPYFNRDWMTEHVPSDVVRIVDTHDCQSQRTRSFSRHALTPTFSMTPEAEGKQLDRYDIALAMSDEDHDEFAQISRTPIVTAPFRLPLRDLYRLRHKAMDVLFIAAQSDVNDLTMLYLLRDIIPLVNQPVRLHIVGNVTVPNIQPHNAEILHHARVDDLADIYSKVDLSLNPTFAGGGVKTKTLEAIAYGVPIITTDEGARGMRHLLPDSVVVNDKESFAYTVGMLLQNNKLRGQISQQMLANLAAERKEDWLEPFTHLVKGARAAKLESVQS